MPAFYRQARHGHTVALLDFLTGSTPSRDVAAPFTNRTSGSAAVSAMAPSAGDHGVLPPGLVHSRRVEIRQGDGNPSVAADAWIAPTAVLSGRVRVGPGSCVLHGAVLTDDGGSVEVGANCVIMEHAALRGTPRHALTIGDHVLAGPHCYLTGCTIGDEVFIATGAMVFNGARMGRASSVALGGTVHIGCVVPAQTRIAIGWVAVGNPARLYPPGEAENIRAGLDEAGGFLPFVFGTEPQRSAVASKCGPRWPAMPVTCPASTTATSTSASPGAKRDHNRVGRWDLAAWPA
jgi:carbonic anhydrase/acetyltransferase-like protein (isoleucine patch superfamily)